MLLLLLACAQPKPADDTSADSGSDSAVDSGGDSADTDSAGDSAETGEETGDSGDDSGETGEETGDSGDTGTTGEPGARRVIGYYTNWSVYGRGYMVTDIPAEQLTHLLYAFITLEADGTCALYDAYADTDLYYPGDCWDAGCERGNFHQLRLLKDAHPHLRTLLSIGGWTLSDHFSAVAADPARRDRFAETCADLVETHGFDGLDVDWEYPVEGGECPSCGSPDDRENVVLLLEAMRDEFATRTPPVDGQYLLTAAVSANPAYIDNLDVPAMMGPLDWVNVMSYDFHGGWEMTTNHNAALGPSTDDPSEPTKRAEWNVTSAAANWVAAGADPADVVVGVPFYGRGWSGVPATDDGLFQPATGLPSGTWEAGVFDYSDIAANYLPTMDRHWSEEASVPWLYSAATGVFITYDDAESLQAKVDLVRAEGLGGVMFWELSGDDDAGTLLSTVYDGIME